MRPNRLAVGGALLAIAALPSPARAQNKDLANVLLTFFSPQNPVILAGNANPAFSHAAHFVSQEQAQVVLKQVNAGIAAQISTFPIGASSAGFTYTFDENLGVYNRTTQSFGPIFTERPLTAGKNKFTFGVNYLDATWDSLEGKDLKNGSMVFYLTHQDVNHDGSNLTPWFEGDLIKANLHIDLESKTTVLYANYGITERLDFSAAVPFVYVRLNASIDATIDRLATGADPFIIHQFDDGSSEHTYPAGGSAQGVGDILLRGKYNFLRKPGGSMAALLDVRLPTGNEKDLLGSGATQAKLELLAAGSPGRFSPRIGVGYTFSHGGSTYTGDLPDELYYTAGFDVVPHKRVTIAADFIGRTLLNAERIVDVNNTFQYDLRLDPTVRHTTLTELGTATGNVNLLLGSAGLKINPVGHLLLVGNVLFKIGNHGLQDKLTPVFGIDYTF